MKLALLLLSIFTICYSIPMLSQYRTIDVSNAHTDPVVSSLLKFGADQLIKQGLYEKKLPHPDFHIAKVNHIHMQSLNGLNYKFDVNLKDDNGLLVNSAFTMNYQPTTQEKSLRSLTYSVRKVHPLAKLSHYETLDNSVVKDDHDIAELLQFGVQHVIQKGIHENQIPLRSFSIGSLLKVQKHDLGLGSGSYYHFKVDLTDGHGTDITAKMTLFHNPFTHEKEVIDAFYKVKPFTSELQLASTSLDAPSGYTAIDVTTIASNAEAQDALQYGQSQIIQKGIAEQKLSLATYNLDGVTSAQKQTTGSGVNYQFTIKLVSGQTTVSATFTVAIKASDQTKSLSSYSYQVNTVTSTTTTTTISPDANAYQSIALATANADPVVQTCQAYGTQEILRQALAEGKITDINFSLSTLNSVESQTVSGYSFYRFNAVFVNGGSTLTATFVVAYNLATKNTGMNSFLYKVVTTQTTSTAITTDVDGYTAIASLDVQSDAVTHACLEYGISQIIEKGLADKKIPVSQFTLSNVNSAGKLAVGELTNYKFDCDLDNKAGTTIRSTFTIQYNTKSLTKSLKAYSYTVNTATSTAVNIQPDDTAYVVVDYDEWNTNTQIQASMTFCQSEILRIALAAGKITSTGAFKIIKTTQIQKQKVQNYLFTKIEFDLGDSASTSINVNAVVALNTANSSDITLKSYVYTVKVVTLSRTVPADSAYTSVDSDTVDQSLEIQNVLTFAMNGVLAKAVADGKIKDTTNYGIDSSTVKSASVTGATYYKLTLAFSNGKGSSFTTTCTVQHTTAGKNTLGAYTYNVKTITSVQTVIVDPTDDKYSTIDPADVPVNSDVQSALTFSKQAVVTDALNKNKIKDDVDYNVNLVTYAGKAVVSKNTFYKLVVVIGNDEDTTITATLVLLWDTKASQWVLRQLTYNVTIIQNVTSTIAEPSDDEYSDVDADEVDSSDLIRSILGVGTQQVIQAAINDGKIQDPGLTVSDIAWVSRATVKKVFTFYRFSVTLSNYDDTTVTATFTIVHDNRSLVNTLRRYAYQATVIVWTVTNIVEPTDDQYVDFHTEEVTLNDQIHSVFSYSIQTVLSAAIADGKIQNSNFDYTVINSSSKATVRTFTFYKFAYTLDNDDDTTIDVTCTAVYDSKSGDNSLRAFAYKVTVTQTLINDVQEPTDDAYVDFDQSLVESDDIVKKSFSTGLTGVLNQALTDGKINSVSDFNMRNITMSKLATVKKFTFYRFTANIDNDDDTYILATFTVVYSSKTGEYSLRRYLYNVSIILTLITDIKEPADSDYTDADIATIDSNDAIHTIFTYGINELLTKAVSEGNILNTDFTVKATLGYKTAVVKEFTFHRFAVTLTDGDETTVDATLTVVHSSKTDENSLRRYNYQVTVIHVYVSNATEPGDDQYTLVPIDQTQTTIIQQGLDFAQTQIIANALSSGKISSNNFYLQTTYSIYSAIVSRFTFYRYNFTLTNGDDTTIQAYATVVYDSRSGQYGVRSYVYNVIVVTTLITDVQEPSDDEYINLEITTLDTDSGVHNAFSYGVQEVINKAYTEGKTSSTTFSKQDVTVIKTATVKQYTFYRYSFTLTDGEGTTLDCSITVIYSSKTGEYCLRRYVYNVTVVTTTITDIQEPSDGEYTDVDSGEWEFANIKDAYTFGYQAVIEKAVSDGKIAIDSGLTLKTVLSVRRASVKSYVFYRFELHLENGKGAVMDATITVVQNTKTGECSLRRYVYKISITTTTTTTTTEVTNTTSSSTKTIIKYKQIKVTDITGSVELTTMVDTAVRWICTRLFKDGIIKDISFTIIRYDSVYYKYENGLYYYKITVHIRNSYGLILEITFTVSYCIETTQTIVIKFSVVSSTIEIGKMLCIDSEEAQEISKSLIVGNFESVDISESEGCTQIHDAMWFGVDLVANQVGQQEKIADLDFKIQKVNSIYRQFLVGVNYRFNVDLENDSGDKVRAVYTVSADHKLSSFYFVSYE